MSGEKNDRAATLNRQATLILNLLQALSFLQQLGLNAAYTPGTSLSFPPVSTPGDDDFTQRVYGLTPREDEVLAGIIEGKSNRQIAQELVVSLSTVKYHVSNILSKTGAKNRTEAVATVMQRHHPVSPFNDCPARQGGERIGERQNGFNSNHY